MSFIKEVLVPSILVIFFGFLYLFLYGVILNLFGWSDPGGPVSLVVGLILAVSAIFSGMLLSDFIL